MGRYDHCSKEELLRIVAELEAENNRLKAAEDQKTENSKRKGGVNPLSVVFGKNTHRKFSTRCPTC